MAEQNQITFESAMETLCIMFPSWKKDALAQILIKKKGYILIIHNFNIIIIHSSKY